MLRQSVKALRAGHGLDASDPVVRIFFRLGRGIGFRLPLVTFSQVILETV
ncbi:hypothetical protein [Rhizobium sp. PL01]|nr:hypothetical protein [Rhizobium sp. PL01]MDW5316968.1 hypothetical protein [Rhizobium sp. PL01]